MPSSTVWLAPHVHAALDETDLVLLDVTRDAYFCLPEAGQGVDVACGARALRGLTEDVGIELLAAGLADPGGAGSVAGAAAPAAGRDLVDHAWPAVTLAEAVSFLASLAAMGRRFRRRSFAALVATARERRGAEPRPEPSAGLERRALAFQALLPWSPVQGACLFQAFLLLDYLHRAGLSADWVFGVRTWPFSAHCWLQSGDLVLNDSVERVMGYRPILVV